MSAGIQQERGSGSPSFHLFRYTFDRKIIGIIPQPRDDGYEISSEMVFQGLINNNVVSEKLSQLAV